MKKILSVLSVIAIIFAFAGCQEKRSDIIPVTKGITFTGDITYYNECYECFITVYKNGNMKIEMTSPDTIKGMSFNFENGQIVLKYNDLEYNYESDSMPEGIVCNYIYDIFQDTAKDGTAVIDNEDNYYVLGDTGKCDYKMYVGATGLPIKIEESNTGLCVNAKNVTLIKE